MAAESVGLAASIAGLVSLGLQVTGGIFKYVDAFKNRQEDLHFVKQQNEALRTTLQLIGEYVSANGSSPDFAASISGSMQLFEEALGRIENLYPELVDSGGKSWTSRLDNRRKRLTYPFNRSKIQQLGQQLEQTRGVLQLTLNAIDMRVSRQQHAEALAAMEVSFRGLSSETQLIRSGLTAVEAPIVDIRDQLSTTHEAINTSTQLLVSQYGAISYQAQESNQVFLGKFQETANLVQRLAELCSKQHQETIKTIERLAEQTQQDYTPGHAPVALVRRLAEKPALLKEVSNAIRPFEQAQDQVVVLNSPVEPLENRARIAAPIKTPQLKSILGRICICPHQRQRKVREQRRVQLGDSSFFGDWETQSHWDACPLSKMGSKKRRVAVGFNYTGLVHILRTAINVSFALTYGAGGFSISPSFACNPTVDSKLDPAFSILHLLGESLDFLGNGPDGDHLMLACMKRLIRLFDDGKVCPTAVNRRNESLMHIAIFNLYVAESNKDNPMEDRGPTGLFVELVQMLLSYGVAPFTYDLKGLSPMLALRPCMFESEFVQPVLDVLFQANLECQPVALDASSIEGDYDDSILTDDIRFIYGMSSGYAQACQCGPLSMAVIQDDMVAVSKLLNRSPRAMNEINVYGQTPLHLAATTPWILDILLRTGDRSLLDYRDVSGFTALEVAMIYSSKLCVNKHGIDMCYDNECDCCQCIDLLFAAGCTVRMHKLDESQRPNAPELCVLLDRASELARRKYVSHMRRSRMAIQAPQPRKVSLASKSGVADDLSWIFNEIADPYLGALFYRHGFRPHSSCLFNLHADHTDTRDIINIAYLRFLLSHGVDILFRLPSGPALLEKSPNCGLFGVHFAFYFIELDFPHEKGSSLLERQSDDSWKTYLEFTTAIFRRDLTDGCQCHCTVDGCTPFTWMMKGNSYMTDSPRRNPGSPSVYADLFKSHYSRCGSELTTLTYMAAIRYATFTALNISHTCCSAYDMAEYGLEQVRRDANEIKAINEKQATLLETLEDLVSEFEEKAVEYLGKDSNSNQGSFHEFWPKYWEARMNQELAKLQDKKVRDVGEKGPQGNERRSWGPLPPLKEGNPYPRPGKLEFWLYELDKICPEYSEPWPEESSRVSEVL